MYSFRINIYNFLFVKIRICGNENLKLSIDVLFKQNFHPSLTASDKTSSVIEFLFKLTFKSCQFSMNFHVFQIITYRLYRCQMYLKVYCLIYMFFRGPLYYTLVDRTHVFQQFNTLNKCHISHKNAVLVIFQFDVKNH